MYLAPEYGARLVPSSLITAGVVAVAHTALLALASGSIGFELLYVVVMTLVLALLLALPLGFLLLAVVKGFRLREVASLMLYVITAQIVTIALEVSLFEIEWRHLAWQFSVVALLAGVVAWYSSVYVVHRRNLRRVEE